MVNYDDNLNNWANSAIGERIENTSAQEMAGFEKVADEKMRVLKRGWQVIASIQAAIRRDQPG